MMIQALENILKDLSGNMGSTFILWMIYGIMGMSFSILVDSSTNYKKARRSPQHFSLKFMFLDNFKKAAMNIFLLYISIRFYNDLTDKEITDFGCFQMGVFLDKITDFVKNKTPILNVDRDKINV